VSPITVTAAPVATQRSCWRSTPREARNRSTTQTRAAGRDATWRARPARAMPLPSSPRGPGWPSGLSNGTTVSVVGPGTMKAPTTNRAGPATADDQAPGERRGGVQPADRVGRPPQGQDQPDGRVAEREAEGVEGAVEEDLGGERPRDQQGGHQPGGAAGHDGQPQRPGEQRPGPRLQRHLVPGVGPVRGRVSQAAGTEPLRRPGQSSSAIRLAARAAPSVSTGR
jgi:hypothetical protein